MYKRNGINVEPNDETEHSISKYLEVKKENVFITCGICKEEKPIAAFGLTGNGRHKHLCTNCELEQMQVKGQPKIMGKGKPMMKFPNEKKAKPAGKKEIKHDKTVEKKVAKKLSKTPNEVDKVLDKIVENKPDEKSIKIPEKVDKRKIKKHSPITKKLKEKTKKLNKQMLDKEAYDLFDLIVKPYLELYDDGFTNKDISNHLHAKRGTQWIYAKLMRMVTVGLLKVERRAGMNNIYFVNEIVPQKPIKERVEEERVEKFKLKKHQELVNDMESPNKKMYNKLKELQEKTGDMVLMIPEDDLIKRVEKIADKMLINFTEKSTTITVSPSNNILRAYDLLSDKQKESAEISKGDGTMLKFNW